MKKSSPDSESYLDRIRFWKSKAHGTSSLSSDSRRPPTLPLNNQDTQQNNSANNKAAHHDSIPVPPFSSTDLPGIELSRPTSNNVADNTSPINPPPAPPPQVDGEGDIVGSEEEQTKKNVARRFYLTGKDIILSSYINILLFFVPVGIAAKAANLSPGLIFALNAVAIVPLAGLLSHATESVAKRMGDTVGALMNVTFGNAVELIIFIALSKDEIRIVQASLLGSILANLLLILGMCFLVGGLRFREQIYNSTITQMSACLLSLSVMSLLLPTAFHASFNSNFEAKAENAVLKVSRGTSVILLLVYGMYLLFQLKSHAYMYESTPQHIIDEEALPGPVAAWMDSDSSSDSSSSSDSDASSSSNTTAKRMKRLIRGGRRRRKSSAGSKEVTEAVDAIRTPSLGTSSLNGNGEESHPRIITIENADDGDDEAPKRSRQQSFSSHVMSRKERKRERKAEKKAKKQRKKERKNAENAIQEGVVENTSSQQMLHRESEKQAEGPDAPVRVDFAISEPIEGSPRRPFTLRTLQPRIPRTFSSNVFTNPLPAETPPPPGQIPRVRYGIRRTNSLPDRLNQTFSRPTQNQVLVAPARANSATVAASKPDEENISRTTAVFLLLISTGLVAVCAEFMVDSINSVVGGDNPPLSEAFVGLIILPIVGNAAEHVTAVTVAFRNKVDLAVGITVGSSIQISLFVTPFIVLLGWCMSKDMSLYFNLFETVSLFVSAFIVNFLVLDGRSNYLEGALLCAAYVIIAVAAFFYPAIADQSTLGGNADASGKMMLVRGVLGM